MFKSDVTQLRGSVIRTQQHLLSVLRLVGNLYCFLPRVKVQALSWVLLCCAVVMPIPSFADAASITLDHVDPANIMVRSQNYAYSEDVIISELDIWVNVNVEANRGSGIFQIDLHHKVQSSFLDREELSGSNSIPFHAQAVSSYRDSVKLFRARHVIKRFAVGECDKNKALMLSRGNRLDDIFARDQIVPVTIILSGQWIDISHQYHQIRDSTVFAAFQITCSAHNNTAAAAALDSVDDRVYRVKQAKIQTSNITRADGSCEVAVQVGVTTNRPNFYVEYQLVSPLIAHRQNYRLTTDQYGRGVGNHKFSLINKPGIQTGTIQAVGYSPAFLSNVVSYTINCPIGHGLKKMPSPTPAPGIPKDGKLKIPGITPLSGTAPREKPTVPIILPSNKPNVPIVTSPVAIPNNGLPEK